MSDSTEAPGTPESEAERIERAIAGIEALKKLIPKARALGEALTIGFEEWVCPLCKVSGKYSPVTIAKGLCGTCRLKAFAGDEALHHVEEMAANLVRGGQAKEHAEAHWAALVESLLRKIGENVSSGKEPLEGWTQ